MKIQGGIYLIIDPSMDRNSLVSKLKEVLEGEIAAVQIWDNFKPNQDPVEFANVILQLCHAKKTPVLVNNRWELLKHTDLDGVHFDNVPENILQIKSELNRNIISGITCNNDLSVVKWAHENGFDYISFCSMFPSSTANSCELVKFDTIKKAREITSIPIFLAGGIKPENIKLLNGLEYSGIAVVSGIMNANNPLEALKKYQQELKANQNEIRND